MNRKDFLINSILATGGVILSNTVFAHTKTTDLIIERSLVALPDKTDYKYNSDGEVFVNTQLAFFDRNKQLIKLPEKLYLSQDKHGYGTPTLFYDGQNYYVFASTLFKSYKMDGLVYCYSAEGTFTKTTLYQHENRGWYAFWGQYIDNKPVLYHYDYTLASMMRTQLIEENFWHTERIYQCHHHEAIRLYHSQLKEPTYRTQAHQFGFTYPPITDGFYQFLLIMDMTRRTAEKERKTADAEQEAKHPTVFSSLQRPNQNRTLRNRQSLADATGGCGCEHELNIERGSWLNVRLIKNTQTTLDPVEYKGLKYYPTRLSAYDHQGKYHKLPDTLYCLRDGEGYADPVLYSHEGISYIYTEALHKQSLHGLLYQKTAGQPYELLAATPLDRHAEKIFFGQPEEDSPALYRLTASGALSQYTLNSHWRDLPTETSPLRHHQDALLLEENLKLQYGYQKPTETINPFLIVYCDDDDLSGVDPKPTVVYKVVPGSKIEIPNMPAFKTQDTLGECRAFSLRTIYQKYVCDYKKIENCKNPPTDQDISSFGMMMYTHLDSKQSNSLSISGNNYYSMYDILNRLQLSMGEVILESCKPFTNLVNSFTLNGSGTVVDKNQEDFDNFINKIKKFYENNKSKTEADVLDCPECLNEMNQKAGLNLNIDELRSALKSKSYEKFMYAAFFKKCDLEEMPKDYKVKAYPDDEIKASALDIKNKIIEGLNKGKPVLTPAVCIKKNSDGSCPDGQLHSMVISGTKQVCHKSICKQLFKVHNSWGEEWQTRNAGGWIDADEYTKSFGEKPLGRISSESVIWLE